MGSITAANSVYVLSISGLLFVPTQLQGYAADDVFETEPLESTETSMGVDGTLSAGFVFKEVKQSIILQADSASNQVFDDWQAANRAAQESLPANGLVNLKSISTKWTLTNGYLTGYPPMPNAGKLLKPRKFTITWENISPAIS